MTDDTDPHRFRHLRGCHPDLKARVRDVVRAMEVLGYDLLLTQGVRSAAQQAALYAQGRSRPGKIVTNCDGLIKVSNHQPKADGYGYAVDVAWRVDGEITWDNVPWDLLGQIAEANGLRWGGNFTVVKNGRVTSWPDMPHLELHSHVPPPITRA